MLEDLFITQSHQSLFVNREIISVYNYEGHSKSFASQYVRLKNFLKFAYQ